MKTRFLALLALAATAIAATSQESFEKGDHLQAATMLQEELTKNPSAEGYVNVAQALENAGRPAEAILNYERALLLDPGLAVAKNQLAELASKQGVSLPPHEWTDDVVAVAHPDTLIAAGSALGWICAFVVLFQILGSGRPKWLMPIAVVGLVAGAGLFALGWVSDPRIADASMAVVTSPDSVDVLTQPATNSDKITELPPGSPVGVLSPRGAWTYIDLSGGAQGWIPTDRLTPVIPGETL